MSKPFTGSQLDTRQLAPDSYPAFPPHTPNIEVLKPQESRDTSPSLGIFTPSYFLDSDNKSQHNLSVSRNGVQTTTTTRVHQFLIGGTRAQSLDTKLKNDDSSLTNTPLQSGQKHIGLTMQEMTNSLMVDELARNRKIAELENQLFKERPTVLSQLNIERDFNATKTKDYEPRVHSLLQSGPGFGQNDSFFRLFFKQSPYAGSINGYNSNTHSVQYSKDEVSRLYTLCKEKDQIIANLMDDLAGKPSREAAEAERSHLMNQINNYKLTVIELENKTVMLATEIERLTRKVQDQEYDFQKKTSESAFTQDRLNIEIEEIIRTYEERLNKLLMDNEKLALVNESMRTKIDQMQAGSEQREKQHQEQLEQVRVYWKEFFQKELQEHMVTVEMEKGVYENQLKHTKQTNSDMDLKIKMYLSEIHELNQAILEKDSLIQEFQLQLSFFDRKQKEFSELQFSFSESNKQLVEIDKQLQVTSADNNRLNDIITSQKDEVELWKQRYNDSNQRFQVYQVEQQKVFQETKRSLIEQKENLARSEKDNLDHQARMFDEEKMNLLVRIVLVQAENEKSHHQIIAQQRTIDDFIFESKQSNQQILLLQEDNHLLLERNDDLQRKIESLIQNIDDLNSGLQSRIEEVEIWRIKYEELQAEVERRIRNMSISHEQHLKDSQQRFSAECDLQKQEFEDTVKRTKSKATQDVQERAERIDLLEKLLDEKTILVQGYERKVTDFHLNIARLESDLINLRGDLEREKEVGAEKERELYSLHINFTHLETTNTNQHEDFLRRVRGKDNELDELKKDRSAKILEIETFKTKLMLLESELEKRKIVQQDTSARLNQELEKNEKQLIRLSEQEVQKKEEAERTRIVHLAEVEDLRASAEREKREIEVSSKARYDLLLKEQSQSNMSLRAGLENTIVSLQNNLNSAKSEIQSIDANRISIIDQHNSKSIELDNALQVKSILHVLFLYFSTLLQNNNFECLSCSNSINQPIILRTLKLISATIHQISKQQSQMQLNYHSKIEMIAYAHFLLFVMLSIQHEREITSLKGLIDSLSTDINLEQSKFQRCMLDYEKACRDVEIWRSKAGQIDPSHPYIMQMQSQLDIKRRENLDLQSKIHEVDRRRNDLERMISRTTNHARAPSADIVSRSTVIQLERSPINLGILEENDKVNRLILSRCREIVHNKY